MAGRSATRKKVNETLIAAGLPPVPPRQSLTPLMKQAAAIRAAEREEQKKEEEKKKAAEKRKAKAEEAKRKAAGIRPRAHHKGKTAGKTSATPPEDNGLVSPEEIRKVLKQILLDPKETGSARISAAEKLLQMDGTAPQYQKALMEVRLTAYRQDQFEHDKRSRNS